MTSFQAANKEFKQRRHVIQRSGADDMGICGEPWEADLLSLSIKAMCEETLPGGLQSSRRFLEKERKVTPNF